MGRLDFPLDNELHKQAKKMATDLDISLREYVAQAIAEKLERDEAAAAKRPKKK